MPQSYPLRGKLYCIHGLHVKKRIVTHHNIRLSILSIVIYRHAHVIHLSTTHDKT